MLNVITLSVIMLSVIMMSVIMLNVVMLNVIMVNVVMLNVVAPIKFNLSFKIQIANVIKTGKRQLSCGLLCKHYYLCLFQQILRMRKMFFFV
jgi:hypothetical protein